jgi:hypothetical protein
VTNATYLPDQRFPAVPGMVDLVKTAEREGYAVFFLTGRGAAQAMRRWAIGPADGVGVDAGFPKPTTSPNGQDALHQAGLADYPDYVNLARP